MKNILLTGSPDCGKTSVIQKLIEIFKEFNPNGFYKIDIIEDGLKAGSQVVTLTGDSKTFSHMSLKSKNAVGKFKVDIKGFDDFLNEVFSKDKKVGFYFIDEIGKMECMSKKFQKLIPALLDSEKPVLATISEKGTGMITTIRKRKDVLIYEVTSTNHDLILKELTMKIRDLLLE